jgi:predicted dehydrogenase/threonine dehydrogenase-like Zn-dependent dehydrogenase
MKQVVQPIAGGSVEVLEVPRPTVDPTEVLVRTYASIISAGTEDAVTALARSSLLAKARARPDLVRQVMRKACTEGLAATAQTVRSRLAEDLPLGYSAAGEVIEVGSAVTTVRVGQLVATGGAGKANHAEYQAVPGLLCAPVPDGVPAQDAAFATVASIALHGLRLADAGPGSKVVIVGLGLVGQLATRLAMAAGWDVAGIDPAPHAHMTALDSGVLALDERGEATTDRVLAWSRGRGADAVLVCAATPSSGPVTRVPPLCRDRAAVVIVGDVALDLDRTPFYERELSLRFARSYGPGRYEASYEGWEVDYPAGQVRWTEGRNLEAVLDLLAAGRLKVADLVTHVYDIADAAAAYQLIEQHKDPYLAIRLAYPAAATADKPVTVRAPLAVKSRPGVGWIGAGSFTAGTLLPAFKAVGFDRFVAVTSASGLSALRMAERNGFEEAVSGAFSVIEHPRVDVVVIATLHDTHAELATMALKAGKHVWWEKPLALTEDELRDVELAWAASGRQLMVGLNRRWSPAVLAAQKALADIAGPKFLVYRVAAGPVPDGHWYADRRQGGRLLGEVCHFVDTAQALIGAEIEETVSVLGGQGAGVTGNDAVVSMPFADRSLATICYGSALPTAGKEWIEVSAWSHRLVIDDFRSAQLDGRALWKGRQDKGHMAQASALWQVVRSGAAVSAEPMIASMRATIAAADSDGRDE